jgi:hydrogenase maturation protein HypF
VSAADERERLAIRVTGLVQGVGFRPFVYAEARARGLAGWVRNARAAVELEVEGLAPSTSDFVAALSGAAPDGARVDAVSVVARTPSGGTGFRILPSDATLEAGGSALPAPDRVTCAACRADVALPGSRRFGYPFTACASCGPRHTIIETLPYDRSRTTLSSFPMCAECAAEHDDPADRRFHAQAIACLACGPALALLAPDGAVVARREGALARAAAALCGGAVLALKGIGGYQLLVDATDDAAIARLRARKGRDEKPFAVLVATLAAARSLCVVSDEEAALLASPEGPIVLLDRRSEAAVAAGVAPGLSRLGVMLPTTPLHDLLGAAAARPLVCTSGNRSDEPLCTDEPEALSRLAGIADLFLAHDRSISRPVDDSVAQVGARGPEILRRARGYAPVAITRQVPRARVIAFGGQQKAAVTFLVDGRFLVGEHVGDLASPAAVARLERSARDLGAFAGVAPEAVACDAHPDFVSSRIARLWADARGLPLVTVQHHHAHAAAVLTENGVAAPALALAWDGAGLGDDGTLWGGEALLVDGGRTVRHARLRAFPLPGGARAMRDPVLSLVGLAAAAFGGGARDWLAALGVSGAAVDTALAICARPALSPATSSMGRLFDGVAALLGIRRRSGYEAAAAMQLEAAVDDAVDAGPYPLPLVRADGDALAELDFAPLLQGLADDRAAGAPAGRSAARFHDTLATAAVALARDAGRGHVVLAGGCFQNRRLVLGAQAALEAAGFTVHTARQIPANDGGLSVGQAAVAAWRLAEAR